MLTFSPQMCGIYIHIPFCRQACSYCDFHFATSLKYKDDMLLAIKKEMVLARDFIDDNEIESVYFGGGTPSLLHPGEIASLIETLSQSYSLDHVREWTLEANPDDLTGDYLKGLKTSTPINRLSIGIQSFQKEDLQMMNRAHDASQAKWCIPAAQDAGFENLSCDLIFGTPSLSVRDLKENMDELIQNDVGHISAYALTIENNTPLYKRIRENRFIPASDTHYESHMKYLAAYLESHAYEQYEISNYARDKAYAIHNTNYWRQVPYWGFGPSAHGYNGTVRRWNVRNNQQYIDALLNRKTIPFEEEVLTLFDQINEFIMTSLRTMWGLSCSEFEQRFGLSRLSDLQKMAEPLIGNGSIILHDGTLFLSPSSRIISDSVMSELFFIS